jgi:hypothetical protein
LPFRRVSCAAFYAHIFLVVVFGMGAATGVNEWSLRRDDGGHGWALRNDKGDGGNGWRTWAWLWGGLLCLCGAVGAGYWLASAT